MAKELNNPKVAASASTLFRVFHKNAKALVSKIALFASPGDIGTTTPGCATFTSASVTHIDATKINRPPTIVTGKQGDFRHQRLSVLVEHPKER